jgi:hypothetical protein
MKRIAFMILALGLAGCGGAGKPGSQAVDLLALIDPAKDRVAGPWGKDGGVLVNPEMKFTRIQVPYSPPEEYDLTLVAERKKGTNSIVIGLVAGGKQFCAIIDAFEKDTASGIDLIDGLSFPDNETAHAGVLLKNGVPSTIVCSVRKDRLSVTVDGRKVVDWKADYARVSLFREWKVKDDQALFLGAWTAPYRVHKLELAPVTGAGRPLR